MPYRIRKGESPSKPWEIVREADGEVVGSSDTHAKAAESMRMRMAAEDGIKQEASDMVNERIYGKKGDKEDKGEKKMPPGFPPKKGEKPMPPGFPPKKADKKESPKKEPPKKAPPKKPAPKKSPPKKAPPKKKGK